MIPVIEKQCNKCNEVKPVTEFHFRNDTGKYRNACIECLSNQKKIYRNANADHINQKQRDNRKNDPERFKEYESRRSEKRKEYKRTYMKSNYKENRKVKLEYQLQYNRNHKEQISKNNKKYRENNYDKIRDYLKDWQANKRNTDPIYRLNKNISSLIRHSLNNKKNGYHWENIVGYTCDDLIAHLEKLFKPGMSWGNYGLGYNKWNIDHIIPVSLFNITSAECKGFKKCWSLENLRPMWSYENLTKKNTLFW